MDIPGNDRPKPSPIISLCAGCNEKDRLLVAATDAMTALNKRHDDQNDRLALMGDAGHSLATVVEAARALRRCWASITVTINQDGAGRFAQSRDDFLAALDTLDEKIVAQGGNVEDSLTGDGPSDKLIVSGALLDAREALPKFEECGDCDGVGWVEGGKALQTACSKCKGTGSIEVKG